MREQKSPDQGRSEESEKDRGCTPPQAGEEASEEGEKR